MPVPDYSKFYRMHNPEATQPYHFEAVEDSMELSWYFFDEEASFPIALRAWRGGRVAEVMWWRHPVMSERVFLLMEEECLTGWKRVPVVLYDRAGNLIEGYWGFGVTGRVGYFDYTRSEIEVLSRPQGKVIHLIGARFENDEWDGSDFCRVGNSLAVVATERAVCFFRKHKIRNVQFEPVLQKRSFLSQVPERQRPIVLARLGLDPGDDWV